MSKRNLVPITVGQLEEYLAMIKNKDTIVQVGFGEQHKDCNFLLNNNGKLVLHPYVYESNQENNIFQVLSLNVNKTNETYKS